MQAWQVFVEVPGKPPVELPEGESVVGRSRTCAVHIPESTVSRQHAKLLVGAAGKVIVRDLGSSNGTFVNGEKVDGERALANGDRVTVGEADVVVRILPPVEPADATMKVHIPPMTAPAPEVGATQLFGDAPPPLPPVAAASPASPAPPPPIAPPPPPRAAAPPAMIDPPIRREGAPPPVAATTPPPPALQAAPVAAPQKAADLLPSIQEIEKMPLPPPAAKKAGAPAPAAAGATVQVEPAGFWIRVAANLIDGVIFGAVYLLIAAVGFGLAFVLPPEAVATLSLLLMMGAMFGMMFLLYFYYPATKGQTPGKKILGLWIYSDQTPPGRGLGYGQAAMRFVGHIACSFTFSLGYVMVAFTSRKQGLHDLIAKTYVGRKK
jgi:uncharacterized RDD family membrane protein YckC